MHMSRKGNDLVRRLLYTAAQCATKHNPAVKALFARQMAKGKAYNVAIGHCMAKLLRQVFGVWTRDCDFDKDYEVHAAEPATKPATAAHEKSRGPQESGHAASKSGHHDPSDVNLHSITPEPNPSDRAPSASPSHRPDTGSAEVDAMVGRKGRPHSAEPEPRSTRAPKKEPRHHAQRH